MKYNLQKYWIIMLYIWNEYTANQLHFNKKNKKICLFLNTRLSPGYIQTSKE